MDAPQRAARAIDALRALARGCASLATMRQVMALFPPAERPTDEEIAGLIHEDKKRDMGVERDLFDMFEHTIPATHVGYAFKKFYYGPCAFFLRIASKCAPVCPEKNEHNPAHIMVREKTGMTAAEVLLILDVLHARGIPLNSGCTRNLCCGRYSLFDGASDVWDRVRPRLDQRLWFAGVVNADMDRSYARLARRKASAVGTLIILLARRKQLHLPADLIRRYIAPHLKRHAK